MPQNRTEGLRIEWTQPARCVVPQWASVSPSSAKHGSRSPGAPRARRSLGRTRRGPSTSRGPAAHCHAARWFTVNDWGSLPAITRGIIIWAKKYCFSLGFHSLRGSKLLKVYIPVFFIKRKSAAFTRFSDVSRQRLHGPWGHAAGNLPSTASQSRLPRS